MLHTGLTGSISINGKDIAHMNSWELEMSSDIIDVVSFGEKFKEKVPSIKDWSAGADGTADFDTNSGQADLLTALLESTLVEVKLVVDEGLYFKGKAYLESFQVNNKADGAVEMSIQLAGTKAVELVAADGTAKKVNVGDK